MAVSFDFKAENIDQSPKPITGAELYQMPNTDLTELVKGKIVDISPTGFFHGYIENNFDSILKAFVKQHNLGLVMVGEVGLYTNRNPDTVRGADVIFISHQQMAKIKSQSYLDVAPELIVEIMSPNDTWSGVMTKLEEYFNCGVLAVWVVDPAKKQLYVYHSLTTVTRFTVNDVLTDDKALPNFEIALVDIFDVA